MVPATKPFGRAGQQARPETVIAVLRKAIRPGLAALIALATAASGDDLAVAAGNWQTTDAAAAARLIDGFLGAERTARARRSSRALLIPPVLDSDNGSVAGKAFVQCPRDIERVVLLAAASGSQAWLPEWETLRTVLGDVAVDAEVLQACRAQPGMAVGSAPGGGGADQALAAVVPFLQRRLARSFRIVPIVVGTDADAALLVQMLLPLLRDEHTAIVALAPTPFGAAALATLFEAAADAPAEPHQVMPAHLRALRGLAAELGWKAVVTGHLATGTALSAILVEDPNRLDLLARAAKSEWKDPQTQAAFADAYRAAGRNNFQGDLLSQAEKDMLLWLARQTILCKLRGEPLPAAPAYSDTLLTPAGCFVSLSLDGKLRGSIGTVLPKDPLAAAIQRNAMAAAFEDKRFAALSVAELDQTQIQISVLTPPRKLEYRDGQDLLDKLRPGIDGVLLTYDNSKRSTFLPQVWRQVPDKATFLKALCRKADIPPEAWQDPAKTTVELYESFDFAEAPK